MYWLYKFRLPISTINKNEIGEFNYTLYSAHEMAILKNGIITKRVYLHRGGGCTIWFRDSMKSIEVRNTTGGSSLKYHSYSKIIGDNMLVEAHIKDGNFALDFHSDVYIVYTKIKGKKETIELVDIKVPLGFYNDLWFVLYGDCYHIKFD